jgi:uncharacterized membrane protein
MVYKHKTFGVEEWKFTLIGVCLLIVAFIFLFIYQPEKGHAYNSTRSIVFFILVAAGVIFLFLGKKVEYEGCDCYFCWSEREKRRKEELDWERKRRDEGIDADDGNKSSWGG